MDILFTAVGAILVVAIWPALLLYAWNDSMLRRPRRRIVRSALAQRRFVGASTVDAGVPARR